MYSIDDSNPKTKDGNKFLPFKMVSLKDGNLDRNYFKINCKISRHGIFNQKLLNAFIKEFNFLNDVKSQFKKFTLS
jgi:hypothetical protein